MHTALMHTASLYAHSRLGPGLMRTFKGPPLRTGKRPPWERQELSLDMLEPKHTLARISAKGKT